MTLADDLAATPQPEPVNRRRPNHPTGFEYVWDGNSGFVGKARVERPRTWDDLIREADLDPDEVEVVGDPQIRGWDAAIGGGEVRRMRYFRVNVRRRALRVDLDELVKAAKRSVRKPAQSERTSTETVL